MGGEQFSQSVALLVQKIRDVNHLLLSVESIHTFFSQYASHNSSFEYYKSKPNHLLPLKFLYYFSSSVLKIFRNDLSADL